MATNLPLAVADKAGSYLLVGNREHFARLVAQDVDPVDAYCTAYEKTPKEDWEVLSCRSAASRLLSQTKVILRVQELREPVIRKLQKKIEYGLTHALTECQTAYDLAFSQADPKAMLKATEMKARLSKLLSDEVNVTHRFGILDEASTEELLEMRKLVQRRKAGQKALGAGVVVEGQIVKDEGVGPLSVEGERVPSEAESWTPS